jgi:hypothetical protein
VTPEGGTPTGWSAWANNPAFNVTAYVLCADVDGSGP